MKCVVIFHEKGNWDKEAFTAVEFESTEDARNYIDAFRGVLVALSSFHTKNTADAELKRYLEERF